MSIGSRISNDEGDPSRGNEVPEGRVIEVPVPEALTTRVPVEVSMTEAPAEVSVAEAPAEVSVAEAPVGVLTK
jgi:hypothetical protein